jgi:hypothetical protein
MKKIKLTHALTLAGVIGFATTTQAFIDFEKAPTKGAISVVGDDTTLQFTSVYEFIKPAFTIEFQFGIDNSTGFTPGEPNTLIADNNFRYEQTGGAGDPPTGYLHDDSGLRDNDVDPSHGHGFEDTDHADETTNFAPGEGIDDVGFFLRAPTSTETNPPPVALGANDLVTPANSGSIAFIEYSGGTADVLQAGGQIWDIDASPGGNERWRVSAWDANLDPIADNAVHISPVGLVNTDPASLDGMAWVWTVGSAINTTPIQYITMEFIGTKTTGIGLAFDNFDGAAVVVPETSTYALILGGLVLGIVAYRKRR